MASMKQLCHSCRVQLLDGFDNASADTSKDDLNRLRFAMDIVDVIRSTPAGWSARIGLFGTWGSGKTTVLRYIADQLTGRGNIVLNFNPSFDSDFSAVVSSFGTLLIEELARRNILVEPPTKTYLRKAQWWRFDNLSKTAEATSTYFKAAKVAGVGLGIGVGVLSRWLEPSGDQIKRIAEMLAEQRIVVLIDDLDRSAPELLPRFLLSLRELLDLPRFTFVLAFDEAIVSRALTSQNQGWVEGHDFLEKILDFRFSLPVVSSEDKHRLLTSALRDHAPFVPEASVIPVEDLIPDNPRKLKALIRGLQAVKKTIERCNPDEIVWTDIWLAVLLQQESYIIIGKLLDEHAYAHTVGVLSDPKYSLTSGGEAKTSKTDELLDEISLLGRSRDNAKRILEAMRSRASLSMRDVLQWFVRPPAVTWKEFESFYAVWMQQRTSESFRQVIQNHANSRSDSEKRVQDEVFQGFLSKIDELMYSASGQHTLGTARQIYADAGLMRQAIWDFLQIRGVLNADRFHELYQKALFWIAVRNNDEAFAAREAERHTLLKLADKLSTDDAIAAFEKVAPFQRGMLGIIVEYKEERFALRDDVAAVLRVKVEEALCLFLQRPYSLKELGEDQRYVAYKALLFQSTAQWTAKLRAEIDGVIVRAVKDTAVYSDLEAFVQLWLSAVEYRRNDVSAEGAKALLQDNALLMDIWNVLQAKELLPRGLHILLGIRDSLLKAGAEAEAMPLNKRLEEYYPSYEGSRNR